MMLFHVLLVNYFTFNTSLLFDIIGIYCMTYFLKMRILNFKKWKNVEKLVYF